jgi:hypothetical protein
VLDGLVRTAEHTDVYEDRLDLPQVNIDATHPRSVPYSLKTTVIPGKCPRILCTSQGVHERERIPFSLERPTRRDVCERPFQEMLVCTGGHLSMTAAG